MPLSYYQKGLPLYRRYGWLPAYLTGGEPLPIESPKPPPETTPESSQFEVEREPQDITRVEAPPDDYPEYSGQKRAEPKPKTYISSAVEFDAEFGPPENPAPPWGSIFDPPDEGSSDGGVSFPILRFPVYRTRLDKFEAGFDTLSELTGDFKGLKTGSYLITIKGNINHPEAYGAPQKIVNPVDFDVFGKRIRLEKMEVNPQKGIVRMQVTIFENPIPFLVLLSGAFLSAGLAGYVASDALVQVDKILDDTIVLGVLALVGFGGYAAYRVITKGGGNAG